MGDKYMKKNDKLIVILGVIILITASIGIYYWAPEKPTVGVANVEDFVAICGEMIDEPDAATVSDSCPFYPLIATPLAIHYDKDGEQYKAPLYVKNFDDPSSAVTGARGMIGEPLNEIIIESGSPQNVSLQIAQTYWKSSEGVLLIKNNQSGYELGVLATPLASYLRIPVVVVDELDENVKDVLRDLGVKYSLICGDVDGYEHAYIFEDVDDVVDFSIEIVREKFGDIDYITVTNPIDAWPPEVLDSVQFSFGPETIKSSSISQLANTLVGSITGANKVYWRFTIPKDYKYALVKFTGINHDSDEVEKFGDTVNFNVVSDTPETPEGLIVTGSTGGGGVPERDAGGNIITDKLYQETVVYDRGGIEYIVSATGSWVGKKEGEVSASVEIEKLENPVYPMMKQLSSVAPYLTAYHKGIVFGKSDFAFTADDDVITDEGETCPGFYVPRRNPKLTPMLNRHISDNVHKPLNSLLAKLADIPLEEDIDIKYLQECYKNSPVYIALVGGATVLPNYIYQNHVEPVGDIDGDGTDDTPYWVGGGTPSDVVYGNIDPVEYDWSNLANDVYTEYPYQENIVGRITGWDAQDASALITRAVFYDEITEHLDEWKDNFALLVGGGQDFQKPLARQTIFGNLLGMHNAAEPMKLFTGYGEQSFLRTQVQAAEPLGFNVLAAYDTEAMREGLSDDAIKELKKSNLLNRLFFRMPQVRRLVGEGNVKGGEFMESSNFIFANGHGCQNYYGMAGNSLTAAGLGGPVVHFFLQKIIVPALGGFVGPGADLSKVGDYDTRSVSNMNFGPSFMWLESCICGKIDGMYPKASVGQAYLHSGITSLIISPTGTNIGGGYLEPKNAKYDLPITVIPKYLKAKQQWKNNQFDPPHFGFKLYTDLCNDLKDNDVSIGLAFRNARNNYLSPDELDWNVWWTPPLVTTGNSLLDASTSLMKTKSTSAAGLSPCLESKYVTYQEYFLFGDPALNLYEPVNEG